MYVTCYQEDCQIIRRRVIIGYSNYQNIMLLSAYVTKEYCLRVISAENERGIGQQ